MDDLASLIIKKLREDDGPTRGMVALASWWWAGERAGGRAGWVSGRVGEWAGGYYYFPPT